MYKKIEFLYNLNKPFTEDTAVYGYILFFILVGIIMYLTVKMEFRLVDKDWKSFRCHPRYMFIAGYVHNHDTNSSLSYTIQNIIHCFGGIFTNFMEETIGQINLLDKFEDGKLTGIGNSLSHLVNSFGEIGIYMTSLSHSLYNSVSKYLLSTNDFAVEIGEIVTMLGVYLSQLNVIINYISKYIIVYLEALRKRWEDKQKYEEGRRNWLGMIKNDRARDRYRDYKNTANKYKIAALSS